MSEPAGRPCLNCGEERSGPYCAACGQKDVDLERGFWQVLADAVGEAFEADGRLHRTAVPFFLQPGELPRRWAAGQRASFTSPVRVFVFALFVGFVGLQLLGDNWAALVPTAPLTADEQGHVDVKVEESGTNLTFDIRGADADTLPKISQRALVADILDRTVDLGPSAVALMVPLFALGLQLVLWRRRLVDHLVFSLLHHSRLLLLAGVAMPLLGAPAVPLLWLVANAYLVLALRRAYALEPWPTAWRALLLVLGHSLVFGALVVATIAWSAVAVLGEAGEESASLEAIGVEAEDATPSAP